MLYKTIRKNTIIIVFFALIMAFFLWSVYGAIAPHLNSDEYGYWASAAYLIGYDWHNVMPSAYFSYLYGLLLVLPMRIIESPVLCFKFGIFLNAIFIFGLACSISRILDLVYSYNKKTKALVLSCSVFYCSVVTYLGITVTECMLYYLYSEIVFCFLKYIDTKHKGWIALAVAISGIEYVAHQRTIAILLLSLAYAAYFMCKEKEIKMIVVIAVIVMAELIIHHYTKDFFQSNMLGDAAVDGISKNDYSGQAGKFVYLFTKKGFTNFLIGLVGKVGYHLVGTMGMLGIPIMHFIRLWKTSRFRNMNKVMFLSSYTIISLGMMIAVSALYFIGSTKNSTFLLYGRYSDFVMPLYMALICKCLIEGDITKKDIFICLFLNAIVSEVLNIKLMSEGFTYQNVSISQVATSVFYQDGKISIFLMLGVTNVLLIIFLLLREYKAGIVIGCFAAVGIFVGIKAFNLFYTNEQIYIIEQTKDISDVIADYDLECINVIVTNEEKLGKTDKYGREMQFLIPRLSLELVSDDEYPNVEGYYVCHKDYYDKIETKNDLLYENDEYAFFFID